MTNPGFFVSIEGLDGCGKTTQVGRLAQELAGTGRKVTVVRDPGSTPVGERIRDLLLEPSGGAQLAPWAETALFTAARVQLFEEVILPALSSGGVVVSDRYLDSSLVYQGARGLPWEEILEIHRICGLSRLPDLTLILDLTVARALERRAHGRAPDRMEAEGTSYHERVRTGYLELARRFAERVTLLDADRPEEELARACGEVARERLTVGP